MGKNDTKRTSDILIQDPSRKRNYLIPKTELEKYKVNEKTWEKIGHGTVTFVIPAKGYIEEAPPFLRIPNPRPSVLIQDPSAKASYFLTHRQLQQYRDTQPRQKGEGYGISFLLPIGKELIEELPSAIREPLQSGEAGASSFLTARKGTTE